MKQVTKVLLSSFTGASVITGITAGTAIPILSNQNSNTVQTQIASSNNDNDGVTSQSPNIDSTNNNQNKTPVIIKSYSAVEYKQFFEAANSKGETKNGIHKLAKDLSSDVNSSNYFANFYDPVIPQELSVNEVTATPQSFELKDDNTVIYNYNLESPTFSIPAIAVVHNFYQWPTVAKEKNVDANWKPKNLDFIKANLGANPDRKTFEHFVVDHWNESLLNDAIDAFRYYYQIDSSKTNLLKSYFHNNLRDSLDQSTIDKITPEYNALSGDYEEPTRPEIDGNYFLVFAWQFPKYQTNGMEKTFDIMGQLKLTFNKNTKPQIVHDEFQNTDIAKLTLSSVEVNILLPNPSVTNGAKRNHIDDDKNAIAGNLKINILDALYQYVISTTGVTAQKSFLIYFYWFAYALNNRKAKVILFILTDDSQFPKFFKLPD